jgi:hypothetical protein
MEKEELKKAMTYMGLNVKMASTLWFVTPTSVYRWLKGTRPIPDRVASIVASKAKSKSSLLLSNDWEVR